MKDLQAATEMICDLKGNVLALEAVIAALVSTLQPEQLPVLLKYFALEREACTAHILGASVSESTVAAFERDAQRLSARIAAMQDAHP